MIEKKLGEIAEIFTGVRIERYSNSNDPLQPVFERIKLTEDKELNHSFKPVSKDFNPKFYSKNNDILILIAEPKIMKLVKEEGIIIPMSYVVIRLNEGYDPRYVFHVLKNSVLLRQLARLMEGSVLKIVKTKDLKEVKIPVISYEKQAEIGGILEAIDKMITLKRKEISLAEELQKSILNKLLGEE